MERPPRCARVSLAEHADMIQRPPRTQNPGPLQRLCQSSGAGSNHLAVRSARWLPRAEPPVQRPPRVEPPAPAMERPPRADAPVPVERPPRTDAPAPAERAPRSNAPFPMQRPPRTGPPTPVQRPPRTGPPAPLQSPALTAQQGLSGDFPDCLERPPRADNPAPRYELSGPLHRAPRSVHNTPDPEKPTQTSAPQPEPPAGSRDVSPERRPAAFYPQEPSGGHSLADLGQSSEVACDGFSGDPGDQPEREYAGVVCPSLPSEEDSGLCIPMDDDQRKRKRRKAPGKRKNRAEEESDPPGCDLDQDLDRALEDRAKHHNLTAVNVRNILHEVITNEHVVAMMKAAITDTEGLPMFEPKMTRSKLKEVVEKGVVIPTWNLSPIKKASKAQVPQFVDIPLEEEDSSDEEYCPEEEDEEETAEESLLESDVESTASSPRGHKRARLHHLSESQEEESVDWQQQPLPLRGGAIPMGPPPPPKVKHIQDKKFMETLHAVDAELDSYPVTMSSFQSLDDGLIALRTRSKKPLKDVPIGQLEAELQAPDITPDMYDPNTADDDNWKMWLRGLMQDDMGNEDEADDDDDPEYNILEDWDEPDTEDLRNDRAVRITKKEVNELMEELFETFQDEMGISHMEDEGPEDEDSNADPLADFNTPQAMRFEEPLANLLTEQHRTVRAQLEYLRMRKSMNKTEEERSPSREPDMSRPSPPPKLPPVMSLDNAQRKRLQQQMQQHVQLLTQLQLLTFRNPRLRQEANTAQMYLVELSSFAERSTLTHRPLAPDFQSVFQPCNLKDALQLIPLVHSHVPEDIEPPKPPKKNVNEITNLPKHVAWIMATRPLFMYPELVPICAMRARGPRDRVYFTKAEDNLLALGLKHLEGTELCKQLISKYLLPSKTPQQLTVRIKNLTMKKAPENILKFYKRSKVLPALPRCCEDVQPQDWKPPVERDKQRLPFWMKASLGSIEAVMRSVGPDGHSEDCKYPLLLPSGVTLTLKPLPRRFYRRTWRQKGLKPLLIRPSPSANCAPKPLLKPPSPQALPIRVIQSALPVHGLFGVPVGRKVPELCVSSRVSGHAGVQVPLAKMAVPSASTQKLQKPLIGSVTKRKMASRTCGLRAAPVVHSGPLLFAVPNGAVKLVSLGPPCGVLQPVGAGGRIHVATVLLNSTQIPLNQTITSPLVTLPNQVRESDPAPCAEAELRDTVKKEDDEWDCVSITIKVEAETEERPIDSRDTDIAQPEDKPGDQRVSGAQAGDQRVSGAQAGDQRVSGAQAGDQRVSGAQAGDQRVDSAHAGDLLSPEAKVENKDMDAAPVLKDEAGELDGRTEDTSVDMQDPPEDVPEQDNHPPNQETPGAGDSPKNTSSSTDGDVEMSSPADAPRDASSPLDGQERSGEKGVPEEDEEEEFDLTQDEDEMSSASEESILSVPELQETMEKLTWLASERRLSQEGDSEEENTEAEEEEEEDKAQGMAAEARDVQLATSHLRAPSPAPAEERVTPAGERRRGASKGQSSHRARSRKSRARASKDASKLRLLYDERILSKDPLREQKDMAYAQSYLSRVRNALRSAPGTYEEFLSLIYEFEMRGGRRTAVELYESLRRLLRDWPQLLRDFAAFLLPEQALECGLFAEQQAFDKSRRFLRQLEICFLENPSQHQKIMRVLQSCAECPLQEMGKLKTQMWQLLKGHVHLQEEFSLFFDQLRPPASRMEDFEVMNWTEEKDYKFDGFEEVALPDVEEEEENKMTQRSKRRKEAAGTQDVDCSCQEVGAEQRLKRCKRRTCGHCSCKLRAEATRHHPHKAMDVPGPQGPEERAAAGGRVPGAPVQRSRCHTRDSKRRHQPKDHARTASRAGRKNLTVKGPRDVAGAQPTEQPPPSASIMQLPEAGLHPAEEQTLTMCAKNIALSSSGEKVILWTREADRVILTLCQERGALEETFEAISGRLGNKSAAEVSLRFRELVALFQTGCASSEEDEDLEEDGD